MVKNMYFILKDKTIENAINEFGFNVPLSFENAVVGSTTFNNADGKFLIYESLDELLLNNDIADYLSGKLSFCEIEILDDVIRFINHYTRYVNNIKILRDIDISVINDMSRDTVDVSECDGSDNMTVIFKSPDNNISNIYNAKGELLSSASDNNLVNYSVHMNDNVKTVIASREGIKQVTQFIDGKLISDYMSDINDKPYLSISNVYHGEKHVYSSVMAMLRDPSKSFTSDSYEIITSLRRELNDGEYVIYKESKIDNQLNYEMSIKYNKDDKTLETSYNDELIAKWEYDGDDAMCTETIHRKLGDRIDPLNTISYLAYEQLPHKQKLLYISDEIKMYYKGETLSKAVLGDVETLMPIYKIIKTEK